MHCDGMARFENKIFGQGPSSVTCSMHPIRCQKSHMAVDDSAPLLLWFRRVWVVETGRRLSGHWLWMPISTVPGRVRPAAVTRCLLVAVCGSTVVAFARAEAIGAALVAADAVSFAFLSFVLPAMATLSGVRTVLGWATGRRSLAAARPISGGDLPPDSRRER